MGGAGGRGQRQRGGGSDSSSSEGIQPPPRRRGRRIIDDSSESSSAASRSDSSEEEFVLPTGRGGGRRYESYLNRVVNVPSSYFDEEGSIGTSYRGTCKRWGRYKNKMGEQSLGYYIHYDDGDKYWMLESDVHLYVE